MIPKNLTRSAEEQQLSEDSTTKHYRVLGLSKWSLAGPANHRTGEAEHEGLARALPPPVGTRFVTGKAAVLDEFRRAYLTSKELSICTVFSGLVEGRNRLGEVYLELAERFRKGEHKGIRCITSIDHKEETYLLETLLGLSFQIRHTENFPSLSFSLVEDVEDNTTVMIGLWHNLVVSNEAQLVTHFRSIFEELWADGIDVSHRVEEIQTGSGLTSVGIIGNAEESVKRVMDLIAKGTREVLMMMSSPDALRTYEKAGIFRSINEVLERKKKGMTVRVLVPSNAEVISQLRETTDSKVELMRIDRSLVMGFTMLVIDRKYSFILETKDDKKEALAASRWLTTYTESETIASSYATIFETLWKQAELFERLEAQQKMQNEFINIAAHELRSPVQAIVSAAELAEARGDFSRIVSRNAKRLQRLIQDLLDVQKIERNELSINLERVALDELLSEIMKDYEPNLRNGIRILFDQPKDKRPTMMIHADVGRITQVVTNLLDNAVEFTDEGSITVRLEPEIAGQRRQVIVTVSDTGSGIHPSMIPNLFSKFASKSKHGTGLGLYIAKGIVEAHGGKIWGRNNAIGGGATFGFSLAIEDP